MYLIYPYSILARFINFIKDSYISKNITFSKYPLLYGLILVDIYFVSLLKISLTPLRNSIEKLPCDEMFIESLNIKGRGR